MRNTKKANRWARISTVVQQMWGGGGFTASLHRAETAAHLVNDRFALYRSPLPQTKPSTERKQSGLSRPYGERGAGLSPPSPPRVGSRSGKIKSPSCEELFQQMASRHKIPSSVSGLVWTDAACFIPDRYTHAYILPQPSVIVKAFCEKTLKKPL